MDRKQTLRKTILQNGAESLSDSELLEFIILHSGAEESDAELLLSAFGNIKNVTDTSHDLLTSMYGISTNTAVLLKLIPAICHEKSANQKTGLLLNSTAKAEKYFKNFFTGYSTEHFTAAALGDGLWISDSYVSSSDTTTEVNDKCRNIVRYALKSRKKNLIIAHNHPCGTAEPSKSDIEATRKIIAALRPLGIRLVDHIIIGMNSSLSLRETAPDIGFDIIPEYKQSNYYK